MARKRVEAVRAAEQFSEAVMKLRNIGAQMSNLCFNLGQRGGQLDQRTADWMRQVAGEWDAANAAVYEAGKLLRAARPRGKKRKTT